ncbi:MAG: hypothetical protein GY940_38815, partial [bacterium]|nr:hypothetical protein [bacterium]
TAEKYIKPRLNTDLYKFTQPFLSPIYKTGDLASWLPDGNIEFLGRIDLQVKIRGFRIELSEIENLLLLHEKIKETVVVDHKENGGKYLCAYVVADEDIKVLELRSFLSGKVPDYMVPAYFIQLDKLPLTPSGKVDRKHLPGVESLDLSGDAVYMAPGNRVEKKLVE